MWDVYIQPQANSHSILTLLTYDESTIAISYVITETRSVTVYNLAVAMESYRYMDDMYITLCIMLGLIIGEAE